MEILQIKDLSFSYPQSEKHVLSNINLSVSAGEFVVVCGESGCGKSTLLRLIKKELSPYGKTQGKILYNGTEIEKLDERESAAQIGFILQNPESQIVTDRVWHELAFGLESLGCDDKVIRRRVAEMASYFGIEEWFHKKTAELSGGQKQLLNLASVMAMQPKILLLDEPTAQLDPIAAANFITTLNKLNRETGLTVVIVEHRLEELFPIADKVLIMRDGRNEFFGSPQRCAAYFSQNPDDPMKAALPSAMRIFSQLEGGGEAPLTVKDCREYIAKKYSNRITFLEEKEFFPSNHKSIEFKDVFFRYGKDLPDVLKSASFSVYKGEHFCILGGNGSGKTTALSLASRLLKPYRGKVLIDGKNVRDYAKNELYVNNITLLPQNPQTLFLEKTVKEDWLETCCIMKYSSSQAQSKIQELADILGIKHLLDMHPYDLSGGEQQKAALGKVLLLNPKILLLDEPTKGIDACSKIKLLQILQKLTKKEITIITVTHDVEFAAQSADRVGMLFDGQFVSVDTPVRFFSENSFYTTAANRISRGIYDGAILCEQVVELCRLNGTKDGDCE
ncbi:MAG: ATP-binding cassette domain-containing protein [Oscillospiraceae bacterium]|nr:ATP-binding cassette domain-containing protein [Oscillospiraceae bacterium]